MAVRFDPSILPAFPTWTKTYCQNGLLKTAPRKWWTENRNFFFFFLVSGCLKNRYRKKEGKRAAIKKSSTGRVFGLFFFLPCSFMWKKKKEFYSSVWRLRCAISMELLTLVCLCNIFTSTADLVLPRCFPMADGSCLCTDVAEEDKHLWLLRWYDVVFGMSPPSFTFTFILHFWRTKCSE